MRSGIAPGATNAASSGSMNEPNAGACSAATNQLVEPERRPLGSPCALALVHEPETVDVPQQADCPVHPALVREVRAERVVVDERRVELHTDERPGSRADVRRLPAPERNRCNRRCRVVGRRRQPRPRRAGASARPPRRGGRRGPWPGGRRPGRLRQAIGVARGGRSPTPARAGRGTGSSSRSCTRTRRRRRARSGGDPGSEGGSRRSRATARLPRQRRRAGRAC